MISFLPWISMLTISCKSLAKAHAESKDYGGKESIVSHERRKKAPKKSTSSSSRNSSSRKATNSSASKPKPAPKKKVITEKKVTKEEKAPTPAEDDEEILMKEIPEVAESRKERVPGVEQLIDPNAPIQIREDSANRILNAGGNDVVVSGNDGVIVITGGCGKLTLKGRNNQIQCDSVEKIEIDGDQNTLILGSIGGGRIKGDGNNLSWGRGFDGLSPIVESFGSDNSMKRLE